MNGIPTAVGRFPAAWRHDQRLRGVFLSSSVLLAQRHGRIDQIQANTSIDAVRRQFGVKDHCTLRTVSLNVASTTSDHAPVGHPAQGDPRQQSRGLVLPPHSRDGGSPADSPCRSQHQACSRYSPRIGIPGREITRFTHWSHPEPGRDGIHNPALAGQWPTPRNKNR